MDYKSLLNKVKKYKKNYFVKNIGFTQLRRKIMAVEMINNEHFSTAILLGSVHARENITSDLICKMIDDGLFDSIKNFNLSFIIMANPDGVELSTNGIESVPKKYRKKLLEINNGLDFSLWKANAMGVDINNNFDADFKKFINSNHNSSSGFPGKFAESELETKAIVDYTKIVKPFFTISYHSKGEEIYYNYFQTGKNLKRDSLIAQKFASSTGYVIRNLENVSCAGYKDYCVKQLKIPSLTIEVGNDNLTHPIKQNHLQEIYERHKFINEDLSYAYKIFRLFS